MPHERRPAVAVGRDLRIDFFRGLALWMILTDHIAANRLDKLTYHTLGYSDGAEIFIFLSGLSCAIAYGRVLLRAGWGDAQRRVLRRTAQIYAGHLATAVLCIALVVILAPRLPVALFDQLGFGHAVEAPLRALGEMASLYYLPYILDTLPLYLVLIPFGPAIVALLERLGPRVVLGASLALWLAVQLVPGLNLSMRDPPYLWGSNPFAWQLLFALGATLGWALYLRGSRLPRSPGLAIAAATLVAGCFALRIAVFVEHHWGAGALLFLTPDQLAPKIDLHWLRLVHFLAVVYLVVWLWPDDATFRGRWARPLVLCGQNSLEVFCASIVLSLALSLWFLTNLPSIAAQAALNLLGWVALVGVAATAAALRRGRRTVAGVPRPVRLEANRR